MTRSAESSSRGVAWRLRCEGTGSPSAAIASRVRQLMGIPSTTCVPDVVTSTPGRCSASTAPAITERAALPVQSVTTCRVTAGDHRRHVSSAPNRLVSTVLPWQHRGMTSTGTLVLLRHGQSEWNEKNLFTGWVDVDLTELGREEARQGAADIEAAGLTLDVAHTSLQRRAIRTCEIVLDELDRLWIPVRRSW